MEPLFQPCADRAALRRWLKDHLNLAFPDAPMCEGHCTPLDYVEAAYREPAQDLVVWAPRGGGKTRLAAAATLLEMLHKPGIAVRALGGSLEQSMRMWEHLAPDLETLAADELAAKPTSRRARLKNGSSAGVVTQSQRSVRGLRVQRLRCDEVELFEPPIWEAAQLITRSRAAEGESAGIQSSVEAISTHHRRGGMMEHILELAEEKKTRVLRWCVLDVLERCPRERPCEGCGLWAECRGRAKERDGGYLSIDDVIRMKRRVSLETWRAEMLCERPGARGAVFPTFDESVHVRAGTPPQRPGEPFDPNLCGNWLGVDFGFAGLFVCLWIRRDTMGRILVVDEYAQSERIMEEHLQEIERRCNGRILKVFCDPAGSARNDQTGVSNVDLLRKRYGVKCNHTRILDGLERIRVLLRNGAGWARLFIHPRCTRLIRAMRCYRYPERGGELPLKDGTHDHPIDALRYALMNLDKCQGETGVY